MSESGEVEVYRTKAGRVITSAEIEEWVAEAEAGYDLDKVHDVVDDGEPEFIIVGTQRAGGVVLFASTAVTETRFARAIDGVDNVVVRPGMRPAQIPRMSIIVGAKMTSFEQIVGEDYPSALRTLLGEWQRKAAALQREQQRDEWQREQQRHRELPPA